MDSMTLNVVLIALIVFAGLSYLFVINQTSVGGYQLEELQRNIDKSKREYRQLDLSRAELQSMAAIQEAGSRMQMVAADSVQYLPSVGGAAVASR